MKKIWYPIAIIAMLWSMAACNGNKTEGDDSGDDSTALRLAVLPTVECLPFYYAQDEGIFDSLGVKVRLLTYESAMDADTAFTDSTADLSVADLVKAVLWHAGGDSISVIMAADVNLSLMTAQTARIKSLTSIKEKIVAITRHSVLDYTADQMLKSVKLEPSELNKPQINNIALRTEMLRQNQYDGALLPEPYATLCEAEGAARVSSSSAFKQQANPMMALVAHKQAITERRAELQLIVDAYDIATRKINALAADHAPSLLDHLPLAIDVPDSVATVPALSMAQLPGEDLVKAAGQWSKGRELLKTIPERKDIVDSTFIQRRK